MESASYDISSKPHNTENSYSPHRTTSPKCLNPRNRITDSQSSVYCGPYHNGTRGPSSPPLSTAVEYYPHPAPGDVNPQIWSPSNSSQEFPQLRQSIPLIPYTSPASRNSIPSMQPHISTAQHPVPGVSISSDRPYENQHSRDSGDQAPYAYYEPYCYPSYIMPSTQFGPRGVYEPPDARDSWWTDQHSMGNINQPKPEKLEEIEPLNDPRSAAAASAAVAAGVNPECSTAHTTFAAPSYTEYDRAPIPLSFMNVPRMPTNVRSSTQVPGSGVPSIDRMSTDMHDPRSYRRNSSSSTSGRNSHRGSDVNDAQFLCPRPSTSEPRLCGMGVISTSVDPSGIPWLEFQYPREGTKHKYQIRCDIDDLDISQMGIQFRVDNCIYPGAMAPPEEYRGHRRNYETECNNIGWKLVFRNPVLQHKRGLIQRAVDTYRNSSRNVSIRSRRARRLAKLHRLKDKSANRK